ncbi:MAG: hypothetical protein RL670_215 [Actinomycetota bacterium]|jgi:hypothetical protein
MGRHAAEVLTLSQRLEKKLGIQGAKHRLAPVQRELRPRMIPVWGFIFTVAWVVVTVVDPYSGTLTSANASVYDQRVLEGDDLSISNEQTISFARGGYEVVTGKSASRLFVEVASTPDAGSMQAYAYDYIQRWSWGFDQYSCLVKLWKRESNWRVNAMNPSSGAYGIPQSLPGTKMASEGADWLTNGETQIRWGAKYIKGRYGSPCGALVHSNNFGWY